MDQPMKRFGSIFTFIISLFLGSINLCGDENLIINPEVLPETIYTIEYSEYEESNFSFFVPRPVGVDSERLFYSSLQYKFRLTTEISNTHGVGSFMRFTAEILEYSNDSQGDFTINTNADINNIIGVEVGGILVDGNNIQFDNTDEPLKANVAGLVLGMIKNLYDVNGEISSEGKNLKEIADEDEFRVDFASITKEYPGMIGLYSMDYPEQQTFGLAMPLEFQIINDIPFYVLNYYERAMIFANKKEYELINRTPNQPFFSEEDLSGEIDIMCFYNKDSKHIESFQKKEKITTQVNESSPKPYKVLTKEVKMKVQIN
jgi:hypothetical protein